MKRIYLDHAASTPLANPVRQKMHAAEKLVGNPSSIHSEGRIAREEIESARHSIAQHLNASSQEIIFTSHATESINLALLGHCAARAIKKQHIISTSIEHPATLAALAALEKEGHSVTYINPKKNGIIDAEEVLTAISTRTTLITVLFAQNEIGTMQPIAEIGHALRSLHRERKRQGLPRITFHTDACQASSFYVIDSRALQLDMLTVNGSKMYGPKGIGILLKRKNLPLRAQIIGGGQEYGLRSGTENTSGIIGLAAAFEYVAHERSSQSKRIEKLRDMCFEYIDKHIPHISINGDRKKRLPNNIHISIPGAEGDTLVFDLDTLGIAVATGSACSSSHATSSHVLRALKIPEKNRVGSLRITLGYSTTKKDISQLLAALKKVAAS